MRIRHERKLADLHAIEAHASEGPPGPYLTLQLGMKQTQALIDWCRQAEQTIAGQA